MSQPAAPDSISLSEKLDRSLSQLAPEILQIRRHLHANPEVSGSETATSAFISARLTAAGIKHKIGDDGRGIITTVSKALSKAPVIALRAELDALPIEEENQVSYRSNNPGIMHACGHDAHSAILYGTLSALKSAGSIAVGWRGIFQPSEEVGHGAREMIARGALAGVDAIVALHVDPTLPCGQVGLRAGPQTACCQDFQVEICGRGGHGARPHHTRDPIATAAQLVTLIYQALPRRTDARDPLVVTIGQIGGGHAANVIPDTVKMKGTLRALDSTVLQAAREIIRKLCRGTAEAFGGAVRVTFDAQLPGVVNDPFVTRICLDAAREFLGVREVLTDGRPSMGAEDFADYLTAIPGCMIRLGVARKRKKITPLHTSTFDIDENALLVGARLFAKVLLRWPTERKK